MPRALMSVSDKSGLVDLATGLVELGWDIVASGGTRQALEASGLAIVPVERVTSVGEMLGGRVKTLHPAIHAGILAKDTDADFEELKATGYAPIDLVVSNLYPFRQAISREDITLEGAIENIDIGGVALLRAAAKNFARVTVVVDPADYAPILQDLRVHGKVSAAFRKALAIKAFAHTRDYDTAIHDYLAGEAQSASEIGDTFAVSMRRTQELRYGENPHQQAAFYATAGAMPLRSELLSGKPLSYNNILDADAAWHAASAFVGEEQAAVVIVKHLTATGIAIGESPAAAFEPALASDSVSAFGGVIAVTQPVDQAFVHALGSLFVEVIIAPDFSPEAVESLASGRKNCRLLRVDMATPLPALEYRSVLGGVLVQQRDHGDPSDTEWKVVTQRTPSAEETAALQFAWKAVEQVKSNAIVLATPNATVGIGGGLPSRVDAVELAVKKAGDRAHGAVLASDAFFPFPDAIEAAARAGVTAVIQPGGALRDQTVIDAANAADIAMILTGVRHFRH